MSIDNITDARGQTAEELHRFLELSTDMICIAGFDGYFKYLNAAWEKTLGWTVEELTTERWSSFVHPDDLDKTIAETNRQTKQGLDAISFTNRYRAKDGSYRWLVWNSRPSSEHGEMHAIARDVTEQKIGELALKTTLESLEGQVAERSAAAEERAEHAERAERELRAKDEQTRIGTERMRHFLQGMPLGIALIDKDMQYLFLSERFKEDFGIGEEDLALKHTEVFPGADEIWEQAFTRCMAGSTEQDDEAPFTLREGKLEWLRWRADPWKTPEGEIRGMVLYTELVTARKEAEARLRETADDLTRINSELEAFTYSVSHDLKEPLRTLEAFSQFLLADYSDKLDAEGKDHLTRLAQASLRMKHLIEDLLMISRIGRPVESPEPVALERVVADILEGMRLTVRDRKATVDVAPGLPAVIADWSRMRQVFGNLITNAVKFNRATAPHVEVGAFVNDARETVFFVRDNGIGIEPQYHAKIFGVFQRLHRREEFEGTGAGLAIVKRAVEVLGGRIWLESNIDKGSTFLLTLPVSQAEAKTAAA